MRPGLYHVLARFDDRRAKSRGQYRTAGDQEKGVADQQARAHVLDGLDAGGDEQDRRARISERFGRNGGWQVSSGETPNRNPDGSIRFDH